MHCDAGKTVNKSLLTFTGAMFGVAVIILGMKLRHAHAADGDDERLDWGYYAAVAISASSVLAGCLLSALLCFIGRTPDKQACPEKH